MKKRKRKKIIIFILTIIFSVGIVVYRLIFVCNFDLLENIIFKSSNIIIQEMHKGNSNLIILGTGYSLTVNEQNKIIEHDPLMIMPENSFSNETVFSIFYPFESNGLEEASKELSAFINEIDCNYDTITLIGHSKCGVCFANASKWLNNADKVTIIATSAPFKGTPIAESAKENLNFFENALFSLIYSNHNVDRDLEPNSKFLQNADYSGLADCKQHINVVSKCTETTNTYLDKLLYYLDKKLGIDGDGIVPYASQKIDFKNSIEISIYATHASSMRQGIEIFISEKQGSS